MPVPPAQPPIASPSHASPSNTAPASPPPLQSPLASVHAALGAHLTEFAGWRLPLRFTSELAEHKAVREAAGLFDLSHMAQLDVAGDRAGEALDRALTGRYRGMDVGRASYSLILAPDGGVIDDLIVYRLGESHYLVIANAANRAPVAAALGERLAPFSVALKDLTGRRTLIAAQGPAAPGIVRQILSDADRSLVDQLRYYRIAPARTAGGTEVLLARTGYTGEDGFELSAPSERAVALWEELMAAGRPQGLVPAGLAARDTLRLEAGMSLYGHELSRETTPWDAGLRHFVALDKGDFVGRAALVDPAGAPLPPRRRLVALSGTGRRAAREGCAVVLDGTAVGRVTSGALSPTLGHPVALAYVDAAAFPAQPAAGTVLDVDVRGRVQPFTVVRPPFYRRPRPAA
ncbi:MAG: glycine cleavage system aminomethyltransferase GcvT [Bifidobacteriaceae bacterium]|jgi:aminomethyltransferase|nr:glycine cleavage system aminomethyltransferase GcvT [Bifidobacteriaceae bacterium]